MPIAQEFNIPKLAGMLQKFDKEDKVRDTIRYYNRLFR
jgi:hypothetical protein